MRTLSTFNPQNATALPCSHANGLLLFVLEAGKAPSFNVI